MSPERGGLRQLDDMTEEPKLCMSKILSSPGHYLWPATADDKTRQRFDELTAPSHSRIDESAIKGQASTGG